MYINIPPVHKPKPQHVLVHYWQTSLHHQDHKEPQNISIVSRIIYLLLFPRVINFNFLFQSLTRHIIQYEELGI